MNRELCVEISNILRESPVFKFPISFTGWSPSSASTGRWLTHNAVHSLDQKIVEGPHSMLQQEFISVVEGNGAGKVTLDDTLNDWFLMSRVLKITTCLAFTWVVLSQLMGGFLLNSSLDVRRPYLVYWVGLMEFPFPKKIKKMIIWNEINLPFYN